MKVANDLGVSDYGWMHYIYNLWGLVLYRVAGHIVSLPVVHRKPVETTGEKPRPSQPGSLCSSCGPWLHVAGAGECVLMPPCTQTQTHTYTGDFPHQKLPKGLDAINKHGESNDSLCTQGLSFTPTSRQETVNSEGHNYL